MKLIFKAENRQIKHDFNIKRKLDIKRFQRNSKEIKKLTHTISISHFLDVVTKNIVTISIDKSSIILISKENWILSDLKKIAKK